MIVLALGATLSLSLSGMCMNSLAKRLEVFHPSEWEPFRKHGWLRYVESIHDEKFEWYVIRGKYATLGDLQVTQFGNNARLLGVLGTVLAVCAGIAMLLPTYDSVFSCIPGP